MFDLLIKGGYVIDPYGGFDGVLDVGVQGDRIAAVERYIPDEAAHEVMDATCLVVTPGLIDLHAHVFRGVTYWGVDADAAAARSGVTTWVDAGSAGAMTLPGFREFVSEPATARILSFLNISYLGLVGANFELTRLEYCDVGLFVRTVERNRDLVRGVKVRMGTPTVGEHGIEPMRLARRAADECGLPLMVHIAFAPPRVEEVLSLMRPGDILSHCYTGLTMRIVDENGRILDAASRALADGIVLDLGHGSGSFDFRTAEALFDAGYPPDVISSDLHQISQHVPNVIDPLAGNLIATVRGDGQPTFDLTSCLTKLLALGMSLPDAIRAATSRPAAILGLAGEAGTIQPGARADIATFTLEEGRFPIMDIAGVQREATRRIAHHSTFVGGRRLEAPVLPPARVPWIEVEP